MSSGRHVTDDLRSLLPDLADAIDQLVDRRVEEVLAERGRIDNGSPWLSLRAAAAYCFVSPRTMERMVARGQLRTTTVGRRRLVHRDDLDAFLRAAAGRE